MTNVMSIIPTSLPALGRTDGMFAMSANPERLYGLVIRNMLQQGEWVDWCMRCHRAGRKPWQRSRLIAFFTNRRIICVTLIGLLRCHVAAYTRENNRV